jgi:cytoskeleton protein RodZ
MNAMEPENQSSLEGAFHAPAQGDSPGKLLRTAREQRGLSAQQLCEAIQLEPRFLTALEEDRFEAFDAPVFARGFLRKCANFLGLDPVVLLEGYDRLQRGPVAPTHIPPTISRIKPKRVSPWRLPLLGLAALLAVVLLVWWLVVGLGGVGGTPAVEAVPAAASSLEAAPAAFGEPTELPPAGAVGAPDLNASAGAANEAPAAAGADLAAPVAAPVAAPTVGPAGASTPGGVSPNAAPAVPASAELLVQVAGQSWVSVNGADGRRLYVGMANAGVLRFAGPGPWQVLLGDSRQAKLLFGGRELPVPARQNRDNYVVRFTVTADGQVR